MTVTYKTLNINGTTRKFVDNGDGSLSEVIAAVNADGTAIGGGGGSGGDGTTSSAIVQDNAAFVDGTTYLKMPGFIVDEAAGTALSENDAGAARIDPKRAQVLVIEDETTRGQRQTVLPASTVALATHKPAVVALHPSTPAKIWDGTTTVPVKAASVAAVASDPALVVSLSPNSPALLSDGTNTVAVKAASTAAVAADKALVVALSPNTGLGASEAHLGFISGTSANPTSVLTPTSDTNVYTALDLVASNTTAGSIVVPSFTAARVAAGGGTISKIRLAGTYTSGWSGTLVKVRLWTAAPTYTNGDNGAYAVATGGAGKIGEFTGTFEQFADGMVALLVSVDGNPVVFKLASGTSIFWDLQVLATTTAKQTGKTITLSAEIYQD